MDGLTPSNISEIKIESNRCREFKNKKRDDTGKERATVVGGKLGISCNMTSFIRNKIDGNNMPRRKQMYDS